MLQKLFIRNYAIIEQLTIDFSSRLNIITGETGAGKSIIAGALGLILGERADSTALLVKEKKCIVEGYFKKEGNPSVEKFLTEHDFDLAEELVIRREISSNGKSRAFINDTPVNLSQLQSLGVLLVDLHQQFDTISLSETDFQRDVLDALAAQGNKVKDYSAVYIQWHQLKKEVEELEARQLQFEKESDYNRFQFKELEEAGFRENELEEIDAELKLLGNSEGIQAALSELQAGLNEGEVPVIQQLKILAQQLGQYSTIHPDLPELVARLHSAQVELQDITGESHRISSRINYDPARMNELNERLSLGYKLQKKHAVQSTAELIAIKDDLEKKLEAVLQLGDLISQKEKETTAIFNRVVTLASKISEKRQKQVKPIETEVNRLLRQVGMPNARLRVVIKQGVPGPYGTDLVEFLFNANVPVADAGNAASFLPVGKVASGGELSRLMLCIKSLVAESLDLPTMIFDEIDSGISGEAARQVGMIMKQLSASRQVICITHQPQIAGKADTHFFVYKEIIMDRVITNLRQLTTEERITTIAKMLSGEKPTAAAMENAREMVMN
jgi:DNA repair protein RecN (Recombination protein N)